MRFFKINRLIFSTLLALAGSAGLLAIVADLALEEELHSPQAEHADQRTFYELVAAGRVEEAFELAFEEGDELFETEFNALDGVGANVGQGQRFSRVPRADLTAPGQWANHFPPRATGPNGQACNACHNRPADDGGGSAVTNVHRDPGHTGDLSAFIQRNTPHVFAPGALQRLAEEMTQRLQRIRQQAAVAACASGQSKTRKLRAKGVSFGEITVVPTSTDPCRVSVDTSRVEGVSADLLIRPLQWKGSEPTIRSFNRGASHNELGMQAVEIVGYGVDGDFDGIVDEMTIGDQTALAVYLAAQPRPVNLLELDELGLIPPLSREQRRDIQAGRQAFEEVGCAHCHRPQLVIDVPIFSEPSQHATHRDALLPSGLDPVSEFLDPDFPITFDLTQDQPDNVIELSGGGIFRLGSFERDPQGRAIVRLFGDLKHHDMGPGLAEAIDEAGTGASVWITKELWGVASTAPYLHDGRATTLTEAILEHGGEAGASRRRFEALPLRSQQRLLAFLESLVLFKLEEEG